MINGIALSAAVSKLVGHELAGLLKKTAMAELIGVMSKLNRLRARYAQQYETYAFDDGDDKRADLLDELEAEIKKNEERKANLERQIEEANRQL